MEFLKMEFLKPVLVPIHPAGWVFIGAFAFGSLFLGMFWEPLLWIGLVLTAWCVYFFRDPPRVTPTRDGLIVSPADGIVSKIAKVIPPPELDIGMMERTRISIFLNVFDVHVNRIPAAGRIMKLHYYKGLFVNASLDKASDDNERQLVKLMTEEGKDMGFVQIAGLVARRIVCDLKEGQTVTAGERFGIIRFGSRVDVYLPEGVASLVIEGQRMTGGETVLADMKSGEATRLGIKH